MSDRLLTIGDVAERWGVSPKTVARHLAGIPGLSLPRIGRAIRLTAGDLQQIEERSRCPFASPASAAPLASGMPAARSASAGKRAQSPNSPREQLAELLRQKLQPARTPRRGATSLTVMQGGRDASL